MPMSATTSPDLSSTLASALAVRSALAVVAHPDDESFGLGAILSLLAERGVDLRLLCFTHGEASTLGASVDLRAVRAAELQRAAAELGVQSTVLLAFADGQLGDVEAGVIDNVVDDHVQDAELLVVFEPAGVTGHPDNRAATAAAHRVAARRALPVLEWGVAADVAATLNCELATAFTALDGEIIGVDRTAQHRAIACHASQARDNPVLRRRLALQGDHECVHMNCARNGPTPRQQPS